MSDSSGSGLHIEKMGKTQANSLVPFIQHGGFEVMRVFLKASDVVWVSPAEDPSLMELYCVLDGSIELCSEGAGIVLTCGDCFYASALQEDVRVRALGETHLLYVSSGPVYAGLRDYQDTLHRMLDPIDEKDHVTMEHSLHVMRYTVKLFDRLGARGIHMDDIVAASLFHDVGKCLVPDAILKKVGRLTDEEYGVMKNHPVETYNLLAPMYGETAARIARAHHERLDGSGYPDGLRGEEIVYGSRLIAVSDAFDAMTHKRPYNRVKTPDEAVAELRSLGAQYDPEVVEALAQLVNEGVISLRDEDDALP